MGTRGTHKEESFIPRLIFSLCVWNATFTTQQSAVLGQTTEGATRILFWQRYFYRDAKAIISFGGYYFRKRIGPVFGPFGPAPEVAGCVFAAALGGCADCPDA